MAEHESFEDAKRRLGEIMGEWTERPVAEHEGWHFGERVRLTEDTSMASEGEEGWLVLEVVGSEKYNNERIAVEILLDGTDCPEEVDLAILEAA